MTLTRETANYADKNLSKSNATTINLSWDGLGLNPDLRGETPENNHLSPIVFDRG